jgi:hypothetical protein
LRLFDSFSLQTGCFGCASGGLTAAPANIFGNKYGQSLASIQIAREKHASAAAAAKLQRQHVASNEKAIDEDAATDDDDVDEPEKGKTDVAASAVPKSAIPDDDDASTDEEDDDYGPTPAAGIWAGSKKLQHETEQLVDVKRGEDDQADNKATDDSEPQSETNPEMQHKKARN